MNVGQLLEQLDGLDEELEVRLAHQPSWPLQYHVDQVVVIDVPDKGEDDFHDFEPGAEDATLCDYCDAPRDDPDHQAGPATTIVYIAEGGQVYDRPYLPGEVSAELGWR